jgi:hypothetical protein
MTQTDADSGSLASYLKDNPRMMGVLFTLFVLLSQAGTAAAGNSVTVSGP